jgi:hypothetical protein
MTEREYLLVKTMEECNEVAQAISKILIFGEDSTFNGVLPLTNREFAIVEVNDLIAMLKETNLFHESEEMQQAKIEKMRMFSQRSRTLGFLE